MIFGNYSTFFAVTDTVLSVLSIVPNLVCLHHISQEIKREKLVKYYLYFSLVLTTCITSILGNHIYLVMKTTGFPLLVHSNIGNYMLCSSILGIYLYANAVLPTTLVCLSAEQTFGMYNPTSTLSRTEQKTKLMAGIYLLVSWIIGAFSGWYLIIIPNRTLIHSDKFNKCFVEEMITDDFLTVYLSLNFFVPLILLLIFNSLTVRRLRQHAKASLNHSSQEGNSSHELAMSMATQKRCRGSSILLVVLSVFCIVTWMPLAVTRITEMIVDGFDNKVPGYILNTTVIMWHSSTWFNPVYILYKEHRSGNFSPTQFYIPLIQNHCSSGSRSQD